MNSPASADPVRVLLVAQHALFRESLVRLVQSDSDFEIVSHCALPAEALTILAGNEIDVLVADLEAAGGPVDAFIAAVLQNAPSSRILVIQDSADISGGVLALRAGALGIVGKDDSPEVFLRAIRLVASGSAWLDRRMIRLLAESRALETQRKFSIAMLPTEEQVLALVCEGLTNSAVATKSGISEGTVKAILRRLYHRTGARTRSQLVRLAITSTSPHP